MKTLFLSPLQPRGGGGGGVRGVIPASFPSPPKQPFQPTRTPSPGPGLKTLGCYHNPQSADLEGRWMVSEGGALRGSRLR